jgi:hypothetical protein
MQDANKIIIKKPEGGGRTSPKIAANLRITEVDTNYTSRLGTAFEISLFVANK